MVSELQTEVEKMRRAPGIIFVDGATGRRPSVIGGPDVFEIIAEYRIGGYNWDRLRATLHWLTESQLRAALAYAEAYPEDIDPWVDDLLSLTPEATYARYPFMRPRS